MRNVMLFISMFKKMELVEMLPIDWEGVRLRLSQKCSQKV
jgi:hypothetical protein